MTPPTKSLPATNPFWLAPECAVVFLAMPCVLYFHATRLNVHLALWTVALYVLAVMRRAGFSWHEVWHGTGWPLARRKMALLRFCVATALVILLTSYLVPERIFSFPMQRPWFWLLVMVLYPILSAVPQEFVFRSYFFRRYKVLFPDLWAMIAASAFCFGFMHVIFHNVISPSLSVIAGVMIAHSYTQHRSLKWAAVEHAAYGCMVFTVGIGFYFLVGGWRP